MKKLLLFIICILSITTAAVFAACGDDKTEESSACEHTFKESYACVDRVCTKCGVKISASDDHVYVKDETGSKPATCKDDGFDLYKCACGGTKKTVKSKLQHTLDQSKKITVLPDCSHIGYSYIECSVCGDKVYSDYKSALSHDVEGQPVTIIPPTCLKNGYSKSECKNEECGHETVYFDFVAALGHTPKVGEDITVPPTCTEDGYTKHVCETCNEEYTDTFVSATGHDFNDGVCSVCGLPEEQEFAITVSTEKNSSVLCKQGKWKITALKIENVGANDGFDFMISGELLENMISDGKTTLKITCGDSFDGTIHAGAPVNCKAWVVPKFEDGREDWQSVLPYCAFISGWEYNGDGTYSLSWDLTDGHDYSKGIKIHVASKDVNNDKVCACYLYGLDFS